jgi:hypothetical protein
MSVDITVVAPLSLTVTQKLDFGRVLAGAKPVIAPGAANSGRFEVAGSAGSAVTVTLQMPSALTGPGVSIPLTGWSYVASDVATLAGATPVTFAGNQSVPVNATLAGSSGTTKLYFGVGATAGTSGSQAVGHYAATGTITAAYSDI